MVRTSLQQGVLDKLQLVFITMIAGTLTETYFVVRIMVQWVFSDIKYPQTKPYELKS
jgi:hypothetical protein